MSAARPARGGRMRTWIDHHAYSVVASIGRLVGRPWATALTVGVLAIALALPLGLGLALANLGRLSGDVQATRAIDVFVAPDLPEARARALAKRLHERSDVAGVDWRSPDEGARMLRSRGFAEALDALEANPLPGLLQITPRGDETALLAALQALPEAERVQHDAAWRQRLGDVLRLGARLAAVLGVLLGLGALLVVGNTVRLDIQSRREEIEVLQLLGASDGFVRRPFLYLGAAYGALAGALAVALLAAADLALCAPIAELARSYGSTFALQGLTPSTAIAAVAASTLLGWVGAALVTGHYLRQTRPTST
ncbi:permease-like cell division protein FtsX [Cognatilysobacter bugurensis]|uniref:Cell division protein FtsX n=1 Tax=Cognatilysobacter bugurensis TaxID=543356 RepID=A0A918T0J7_9GAMM|nr:permease-like cell division protein FtsX [Lysobacter bugurensis]GHA82448.1 cell division protein FtsX [Lysobacter bugurensis]